MAFGLWSRGNSVEFFPAEESHHNRNKHKDVETLISIGRCIKPILRLANKNPSWGYDRIAGVMKYLGYDVSATTVRNVLDAHGIVPDPERRRRGDWLQFIETQQYVTAATDFAHVEMATEYGLERRHLSHNRDFVRFIFESPTK